MKQVLSLLLLLSFSSSFAQFAKVVDKDGFTNIRESAKAKSKIIGTIKSNEIVYLSNKGDDDESWSYINYEQQKGNPFSKYLSGYIHNSRLKKINSFLHIPSTTEDQEGVTFNCCGIEVEIKSKKLDFNHSKKYFQKFDGYYTFKNKYALGALGRFPPANHYHSISGSINTRPFEIQPSVIENLFDINNELSECYYDDKTKTLYIILNNSDGSDSYNALLVIENRKYKEIKLNGDN